MMKKKLIAVAVALFACIALAGCGGGSSQQSEQTPSYDYSTVSGEDEIAQAAEDAVTNGMQYGGNDIKTIGEVKDSKTVIGKVKKDYSSVNWIVVDTEIDEYDTVDNAFVNTVQCAAALANTFHGNKHVSRVVYNLDMDTDGTENAGKIIPVMQITYSTKNPPEFASTKTLLSKAQKYNIKPALYNSLSEYSDVPRQKK